VALSLACKPNVIIAGNMQLRVVGMIRGGNLPCFLFDFEIKKWHGCFHRESLEFDKKQIGQHFLRVLEHFL
jgi:hypothetical protein